MMNLTMKNGEISCVAEMKGRYGVYLDNDALIELATRDLSRRQRFVSALHRGGTLLFSLTNAVEVAGLAKPLRDVLDSVGNHWIPLHMDPWTVADREKAGLVYQAPVSEQFMVSYFQERTHDLCQIDSKLLDLSAEKFFRLSAVLDWGQENKDSIRAFSPIVDDHLRALVMQGRAEYEKDPSLLDRMWPSIKYDDSRPATFVMNHLLRMLVLNAKGQAIKKGDGLDFCHAVMATAYGSIATLDKQWKRRVEKLPKPNRLAKMYYRPEVDQLVHKLETLVALLPKNNGDSS